MADQNGKTDLPSSSWTAVEPAAALARAYDLADAHASRAADWYAKAMKRQGLAARSIRFFALLLFGVGGIIPIAKSFLDEVGLRGIAWNDLGYIALAVGAGLLGFDHFFGISSAYTRFVTAEISIRNAQLRFQTDWLTLLSESGGLKPDALKPFVERLKEFVGFVPQVVDRETAEWVAEFRSNLSDLEKLGSRGPQPVKLAAITPPEPPPPGAPGAGGARPGGPPPPPPANGTTAPVASATG